MASVGPPNIRGQVKGNTDNGTETLPSAGLYRLVTPGVTLWEEERDDGDGGPVMEVAVARFNEWAEIDSIFEGHFMERLVPGATKKTIRENRDRMKVLFNHGRDPYVGIKPLGPIRDIREEDEGPVAEVPLLEADYVRDTLLPGLRAGLYGASMRFDILREEMNLNARKSEHNPKGLPERSIKEIRIKEFGPVTFPAYDRATARVRSLSDDFWKDELWLKLAKNPERLRSLLLDGEERDGEEPDGDAPSEPSAGTSDPTPAPERRVERTSGDLVLPPPPPRRGGVLPGNEEEAGSWRPLRLP